MKYIDKKIALLISILLIAFIPRTIELFSNSSYFGPEQAYEYLLAKRILVDHEIVLVQIQNSIGGFFKPPIYVYLLTIPFILTKGDPFGARIFMFCISMATVFFTFIFFKKMFDLKTAFFTSFFIASSPEFIDYAGKIWPPFIIPILTIFYLYLLFKILRGEKKYFIFMMLIIGLMTSFEMATAGVLLMHVIFILPVIIIKKVISLRLLIVSFFLFILTLSPLLAYDLKHDFYNLKGMIKMIETGRKQTVAVFDYRYTYAQLRNRVDTFSWNYRSTFTPHRIIWPVLLVIIYLGTMIYIRDKSNSISHRLFVFYLAISPISTFLLLLFYPGNIVAWWLIQLATFYCVMLGIVGAYFWQKPLFKLLVILLFFALFKAFLYTTYLLYKNEFSYPSHIPETRPIDYIYQDAKGKPFGIVLFTRGTPHEEHYEYLIWWYGTKYENYPNKKNQDVLYIIIEGNKDRLNKELVLIEKVRDLIYSKEFESYFTVQKWVIKKALSI